MGKYASFWSRHDGTGNPIEPSERVQYKTRDGRKFGPMSYAESKRVEWRWLNYDRDHPDPNEIVEYRLCAPLPERTTK